MMSILRARVYDAGRGGTLNSRRSVYWYVDRYDKELLSLSRVSFAFRTCRWPPGRHVKTNGVTRVSIQGS